jgi:hypothetical protein
MDTDKTGLTLREGVGQERKFSTVLCADSVIGGDDQLRFTSVSVRGE